jgi:hypothetical protein
MRVKKRIAVNLLGLVLAGETALAVGPAAAATPTSAQNTTVATQSSVYGQLSATNLGPRRCRWVKGHTVYKHTRAGTKKVYVAGHKVCWTRRGGHQGTGHGAR